MRLFYLFLILPVFITACSVVGLNPQAKSKPGKYPKFTLADTLRGAMTAERSCYDVNFYELTIEPIVPRKELKGVVDVHFSVVTPTNVIQLDLAPSMVINTISLAGKKLEFSRVERAIYVKFEENLQPRQQKVLHVEYEGKPQIAKRPPWEGGLVWKKDKNKNPWLGVACEDDGASIWFPLKDHIADEPDSVAVNIIVPKGLTGVSNGRLIGIESKGDKQIFKWKTSYPVNTYNITFYVGDFEKISLPYERPDTTYNLEFYVLSYSKEKALNHFKQTADIVRYFEQAFGEFPWWKDGFRMVESPYEGMEHQTAIAYGNGYKNNPPFNIDYIILHETAHEWWGNSLTAPDMAELWLHEGFATYSEALYVEDIFGYDAYLRYMLMYRLVIKNERPVIGPYDVYYSNYKDGDIYTKGAWFLHSLRFAIDNDSLFKDIIRTFAVENRQKTVYTRDFLRLVNEKTGKDFSWIFQQYLYQRQPPKLVYSVKSGWEGNELTYKWENVVEGFNLPVVFRLGNKDYLLEPAKTQKSVKFSGENFSFPYYPYYFGTEKRKKME